MKKALTTTVLIILSIMSCDRENDKSSNLDECSQLLIIVEDCMNLHRGAFSYLENCGSLDLSQAKSYKTCDEILEYVEINKK